MAKIVPKSEIPVGGMKAFMPSLYSLKLKKVGKPESYDNEYGEGHYELNCGDPKLEGTCGEHWSPKWEKICKKYLLLNGEPIIPEKLPEGEWTVIKTNPDPAERRKNITWAVDAVIVSDDKFEIDGLTFDPAVDILCMGGNETAPNPEWGCWQVKKSIFVNTYETLR